MKTSMEVLLYLQGFVCRLGSGDGKGWGDGWGDGFGGNEGDYYGWE